MEKDTVPVWANDLFFHYTARTVPETQYGMWLLGASAGLTCSSHICLWWCHKKALSTPSVPFFRGILSAFYLNSHFLWDAPYPPLIWMWCFQTLMANRIELETQCFLTRKMYRVTNIVFPPSHLSSGLTYSVLTLSDIITIRELILGMEECVSLVHKFFLLLQCFVCACMHVCYVCMYKCLL